MGFNINEVIFGKKEQDKRLTQANEAQMQGFNRLRSMYNQDPSKIVKQRAAQEEKQALGGIEDTKRRIQQLTAQRGIGKSSIGMAMNVGAERQARDKISDIRGSVAGRIAALKERYASGLMAAGRGMQFHEDKKIVGGLLPTAGAIVGGIYGGPGGAKAGYGAGQGIQGITHQQGVV